MKVLLVHDYGTPNGGAELQMLALRRLLRARGHDARLLASRAQPTPGRFEADYGCFGATSRFQVLSQTANLSAYRTLQYVLREFRPDVVHVRMFLTQLSPAILPLLRGVPAIYQEATYRSICPTGTKRTPAGECRQPPGRICVEFGCLTPQTWAVLIVQRRLWLRWRRVFDAFLALSHTMKARLEEGGLAPVEVIYNGVPERPLRPPLGDVPTLACASRFSSEKGLETLLEAVAKVRRKVPMVRLLLAGDGPLHNTLRKQATALGIADCLDMPGFIHRKEMERLFDSAWVQVAPSVWAEPFGNVALEAMMRGTAVIASRSGGFVETVVDGETGLLTTPGDADELAEALTSLLTDRERAERMGLAGRRRALAQFSESACVENFLDCYDRVIHRFHKV